ncbi:hypothetical protein ABT297_06985 [Dactylosporangium sp. NPDC000555]|uniref:hypothetical protein n=1 Tax=Dactylosporangium sp. NPDC000555 TaxID=3154260 RepID=UPI00332E1BCB
MGFLIDGAAGSAVVGGEFRIGRGVGWVGRLWAWRVVVIIPPNRHEPTADTG